MKAWFLLSAIVGSTVISDLLSAFEMKRHGEISSFHPGIVGTLAKKKFLILSVLFMALSFFAFITLMQTADLSFAVPASAASIVLETILAKLVLKEKVGLARWWGVILVSVGVALVAE
jgi:drug/metabolite transporter (DMT)-like permease